MTTLKQSNAYTRMFLMVQSGDHTTPATGLTVTVTLSKAGGAFAAAGGTVTEVANGWYKIALTTTDTGTLGDLAYHCTATGADPTDFVDQVSSKYFGDMVDANLTSIFNSTLISGVVDTTTYSPTTTDFETNLPTGVDATAYVGQAIYFTNLAGYSLGKTFRINSVSTTNSKTHLTVSTMPVAPVNNAGFVILGRIGT